MLQGVQELPLFLKHYHQQVARKVLSKRKIMKRTMRKTMALKKTLLARRIAVAKKKLLMMSRSTMTLMRITTRMITILVTTAKEVTATASLVATLFLIESYHHVIKSLAS